MADIELPTRLRGDVTGWSTAVGITGDTCNTYNESRRQRSNKTSYLPLTDNDRGDGGGCMDTARRSGPMKARLWVAIRRSTCLRGSWTQLLRHAILVIV